MHVEQAFRMMKSIDLEVRPIHHHLEKRVRAHVLLCMLAYYVDWHMRAAQPDRLQKAAFDLPGVSLATG
jgi:transposase